MPPDPASESTTDASWDVREERGSMGWLRFITWGIRALGYRGLRIVVAPTALYFTLAGREATRASRNYLTRLRKHMGDPRPVRWIDTYRHIHSFAEGIHDRLSLWAGSIEAFEFDLHGVEHLEKHFADKRGVFLVGAHLGSFDMMRGIAFENQIPVNIIMHSANAEKINDAFATLDPTSRTRIINADPNSPQAGFEVNRCLQRGEFVATLADRIPTGPASRVAYADFLGERAAFPEGPFLLPTVLRVPIVLCVALRTGPRVYEVHFEVIGDGEPVPKHLRQETVEKRVKHFASRLEHYCEKTPFQWFNFHDFWQPPKAVGEPKK